MHKPTPVSAALLLSSCGLGVDHALNEWEEVSCDAVHCYQLRDLKGKSWLVSSSFGLPHEGRIAAEALGSVLAE